MLVPLLTAPPARSWPTIPQLFIKGEFVGGCDIVTEMDRTGELRKLLIKEHIVPEDSLNGGN